ncbi:MAG: hypothetical protein WCG99_03095 [Candidatus Berkelbacteria bacterium]
MDLDKAIQIAKEINPDIGPSLDLERKTVPEAELAAKLKRFFDDCENAAKVMEAHPGQSYEQIESSFHSNAAAHSQIRLHVTYFVDSIINQKGDLSGQAQIAARRIILSDPRINEFIKNLKVADRPLLAEKIYNLVVAELTTYFENLRGTKIDHNKIVEDLTADIVKKISQALGSLGKAAQ